MAAFRRTLFVTLITVCVFSALAAEIHEVVKSGNTNQFKAILVADPSAVNQQDSDGNTPLHLAVRANNVAILRIAMGFSPDLSIKDKAGMTALKMAQGYGRNDFVQVFQATAATGEQTAPAQSGEVNTNTAAVLTGASSVNVHSKELTGISRAKLLPDGRVLLTHSQGLETAQLDELPTEFLASWGISASDKEATEERSAQAKAAAKASDLEQRQRLLKFVESLSGMGGSADFNRAMMLNNVFRVSDIEYNRPYGAVYTSLRGHSVMHDINSIIEVRVTKINTRNKVTVYVFIVGTNIIRITIDAPMKQTRTFSNVQSKMEDVTAICDYLDGVDSGSDRISHWARLNISSELLSHNGLNWNHAVFGTIHGVNMVHVSPIEGCVDINSYINLFTAQYASLYESYVLKVHPRQLDPWARYYLDVGL